MSYVNKKERIFRRGEPFDIPHARSEARMKNYWSATDRRAWCDEVELRRQHILELNARTKGQFCLENLIPLDLLFNAMAANKDGEIEKLKKKIDYLESLLDIYRQIELTPEQQRQVNDLNRRLAKERHKLAKAQKTEADKTGEKKYPGEARPEEAARRSSSAEIVRPKQERQKRSISEPAVSRKRDEKKAIPRDKKRAREPADSEAEALEAKPTKKQKTEVQPAEALAQGRAKRRKSSKALAKKDSDQAVPTKRPKSTAPKPADKEEGTLKTRQVEDLQAPEKSGRRKTASEPEKPPSTKPSLKKEASPKGQSNVPSDTPKTSGRERSSSKTSREPGEKPAKKKELVGGEEPRDTKVARAQEDKPRAKGKADPVLKEPGDGAGRPKSPTRVPKQEPKEAQRAASETRTKPASKASEIPPTVKESGARDASGADAAASRRAKEAMKDEEAAERKQAEARGRGRGRGRPSSPEELGRKAGEPVSPKREPDEAHPAGIDRAKKKPAGDGAAKGQAHEPVKYDKKLTEEDKGPKRAEPGGKSKSDDKYTKQEGTEEPAKRPGQEFGGSKEEGKPAKGGPMENAMLRPSKPSKKDETPEDAAQTTMEKPKDVSAARTKGRGKAHEGILDDGQRTKPGPGKAAEAMEEGAGRYKRADTSKEPGKRPVKQDVGETDGRLEKKGADLPRREAPGLGQTGAEETDKLEQKGADVAKTKGPGVGKTGVEGKDERMKQKDAAAAKERTPGLGKTGVEDRDGGLEQRRADVAKKEVPGLGKTAIREKDGEPEQKGSDVAGRAEEEDGRGKDGKRKGPGLGKTDDAEKDGRLAQKEAAVSKAKAPGLEKTGVEDKKNAGAKEKYGGPDQKGADVTKREAPEPRPKGADDDSDKARTRSPARKRFEETAGSAPQKAVEEGSGAPKPEKSDATEKLASPKPKAPGVGVKGAPAKPGESDDGRKLADKDGKKETAPEKVEAADKRKAVQPEPSKAKKDEAGKLPEASMEGAKKAKKEEAKTERELKEDSPRSAAPKQVAEEERKKQIDDQYKPKGKDLETSGLPKPQQEPTGAKKTDTEKSSEATAKEIEHDPERRTKGRGKADQEKLGEAGKPGGIATKGKPAPKEEDKGGRQMLKQEEEPKLKMPEVSTKKTDQKPSRKLVDDGTADAGKATVAQQDLDEAEKATVAATKKRPEKVPLEAGPPIERLTEEKKPKEAPVKKGADGIKSSKADKLPTTMDEDEKPKIVKREADRKDAKIKPEEEKGKIFKPEEITRPAKEGKEPPKYEAEQKQLQKEEKPPMATDRKPPLAIEKTSRTPGAPVKPAKDAKTTAGKAPEAAAAEGVSSNIIEGDEIIDLPFQELQEQARVAPAPKQAGKPMEDGAKKGEKAEKQKQKVGEEEVEKRKIDHEKQLQAQEEPAAIEDVELQVAAAPKQAGKPKEGGVKKEGKTEMQRQKEGEEEVGKRKIESEKPLQTQEEPSAIEDVELQAAPAPKQAEKPKEGGETEEKKEIPKQKVGEEVQKRKIEPETPLQTQDEPSAIQDVELDETAQKQPAGASPRQQPIKKEKKEEPKRAFEIASPAEALSQEPAATRTVEEAPKEAETDRIPKEVAVKTAGEQLGEHLVSQPPSGPAQLPSTAEVAEGAAMPADKLPEQAAAPPEGVAKRRSIEADQEPAEKPPDSMEERPMRPEERREEGFAAEEERLDKPKILKGDEAAKEQPPEPVGGLVQPSHEEAAEREPSLGESAAITPSQQQFLEQKEAAKVGEYPDRAPLSQEEEEARADEAKVPPLLESPEPAFEAEDLLEKPSAISREEALGELVAAGKPDLGEAPKEAPSDEPWSDTEKDKDQEKPVKLKAEPLEGEIEEYEMAVEEIERPEAEGEPKGQELVEAAVDVGGKEPSCQAICNHPGGPDWRKSTDEVKPSVAPFPSVLQSQATSALDAKEPAHGPEPCRATCNVARVGEVPDKADLGTAVPTKKPGYPAAKEETPRSPKDEFLTPRSIVSAAHLHALQGVSAGSRDETTETRKAGHKCMAPCRNARDRPSWFGEETAGVITGRDSDTPHDLVPPGYFLPNDYSPRRMPDWAGRPEVASTKPDSLSLLDAEVSSLSDTAIKEEIQTLHKWVPKLVLDWESVSEELIPAPPTVPGVLSGHILGVPVGAPLLAERSTPQTLPEAIYQRRFASQTCRAPCADRDPMGEEPLATIEDVSDINTDSEIGDEIFETAQAAEPLPEELARETSDLDEVFSVLSQQTVSGDFTQQNEVAEAVLEVEGVDDEGVKEDTPKTFVTISEPEVVEIFSRTASEDLSGEESFEEPNAPEAAAMPLEDTKVSEESPSGSTRSFVSSGFAASQSQLPEIKALPQQEAADIEEFADAEPIAALAAVDAQLEAAEKPADKYVQAIEQAAVVPRQAPARFVSWFAPPPPRVDPVRVPRGTQAAQSLSSTATSSIARPKLHQATATEAGRLCLAACQTASEPDAEFVDAVEPEGFTTSSTAQAKEAAVQKLQNAGTQAAAVATGAACPHVCPTSTEPHYRADQRTIGTAIGGVAKLEECLKRLSLAPELPCRGKCAATGLSENDRKLRALQEEMLAKDAYCAEQRKIATAALAQLDNIKCIVEERDDLRKKLENSQCELAQLKNTLEFGFGDAEQPQKPMADIPPQPSQSSIANSCDEEIRIMEDEIRAMRASCLTPGQETLVIKKEVEVLKKYCSKLSSIQEENARLKKCNEELQVRCIESEQKLEILGCDGDQASLAEIKEKLLTLNETIAERNVLQNRVETLERELNRFQDLPEDVELFKRRSVLLDDVLKDRDRLAKRVEQTRGLDEELLLLKQRSERVDELERQLKLANKDVQLAEDELDSMRSKCTMAEIEALNQKTESDTLRSRIVCMEHEMESLKSLCQEQEVLQIEKERLQVSLDELVRMQDDYEHMCIQMKSLDIVKAERERYKRKYEELVGMESECNLLRTQLDKARLIERDRDILEQQTEDLERCICEQEEEIRRLVSHIDCLAQGKEDQQVKMKEVVSNLKIELERKESLLVLSEEKMATMHGKIDTSFHNLSEETETLRRNKQCLVETVQTLKTENAALEKSMKTAANELRILKQKLAEQVDENTHLQEQLENQQRAIDTMQEVLADRESSQLSLESFSSNAQEISRLQCELNAAKEENLRLQQLSTQPGTSLDNNYQLKTMLEQSKCAIERIAMELEQQYAEWDGKKPYRCCPGCTCKQKNKPVEPKVVIKCCPGCTCKKKPKQTVQIEAKVVECKCRTTEQSSPSPRNTEDAKCTCSKATEVDWRSLPLPSDSEDEAPEEAMYTARSADENRIRELENELLKANDTILNLKEQLAGFERLSAENSALRRHSTEVQEVAKDQIEDLVERLQKAQQRIAELEAENASLKDRTVTEEFGHVVGLPEAEAKALPLPAPTAQTAPIELQRKLDECLQEKERLLELVKSLKEQLESPDQPDLALFAQLKADLASCMKDKERLLGQVEQLQSSNDLSQLQAQLDACLNEKEKLRSLVNDLQRQLVAGTPGQLPTFRQLATGTPGQLAAETPRQLAPGSPGQLPAATPGQLATATPGQLPTPGQLATGTPGQLPTPGQLATGTPGQLPAGTPGQLPDMAQIPKLDSTLDSSQPKLLRELSECRATISNLQTQLQQCREERERLLKTISELEESKKHMGEMPPDQEAYIKVKLQLDECLKSNDVLKNTIEDLKKQQSDYLGIKSQLEDCLKEKAALQRAVEELKKLQENRALAQDTSNLADIESSGKEIAGLKADLDDTLKEKNRLLQLIDELQRKQPIPQAPDLGNLKQQLDECLKEKQALLAKLQSLQQQAESSKLALESMQKEKQSLLAAVDNLNKEKEDLDKMLTSNVVTTSRRSSKLENQLDSLQSQNKQLSSDNDQLRKANKDLQAQLAALQSLSAELEQLKNSNLKLRQENDSLKRASIDPAALEALRKENDGLKQQLDTQRQQTSSLLEKMKHPTAVEPAARPAMDKDAKDKDAMQTTINDLENQLRSLMDKERVAPPAPSEDFKGKIKELMKQLEEAQRRADASEEALRNLKASDPTAMLSAEIQKLKNRAAQLEKENTALEKSLAQANSDRNGLKQDLDKAKAAEDSLQKALSGLKAESRKPPGEKPEDLSSKIEEQNATLKKNAAKLEEEMAALKKQLDLAQVERQKASELINENGDLKKKLAQAEGESSKARKELEAARADAQKASEMLLELEKDNAKCKQTVKDLEMEVARLKKEMDGLLNDAKKEAKNASDTQNQLAALKQRLAQLESINSQLGEENSKVKKELEQARGGSQVVAALQDENNKMRQQTAALQSEIDKLQKQLENALMDAKAKLATATQLQDDLGALKKTLQQLQAENAALKKNLADDLQAKYDQLRQKLAEVENSNSKLKKDLQKALDDAKTASDTLEGLKQNEGKLKARISQLEGENDKLKKELNAALDNLKKMGTEVSGIQGDESKSKQQAVLLESENGKLKKDLQGALDSARKAAGEASQLKDENAKLKQRLAQLEAENTTLKSQLDAAMGDLKQTQDENGKIKQKIRQLEEDNGKLKQKADAQPAEQRKLLEDQLNKLQKELEAARKNTQDKDKESTNLKQENSALQQQIDQLQAANAKLKKELDAAMKASKGAEAELVQLRSNEARLKDQLAQQAGSNSMLEKDKAALADEMKKAATDLAKLSELKDSENRLKQRLAQLEAENAKLKKNLDSALADAKQLSDEVAAVKSLKEQLAKSEADNKKLKTDLNAAVQETKKGAVGVSDLKEIDDKLKQRIAQLEAENARLKSDLDKAFDSAKKAANDFTKLQDGDNKLKQKLAQLELDNAKLKKDLERAAGEAQAQQPELASEYAKQKQRLLQLEAENAGVKKQLEAALNDAKKHTNEMSRLQDEINKLKLQVAQLEKANDGLRKDLDAAGKAKVDEAENAKKLREGNDQQKQKISQLEDEISKLKKQLQLPPAPQPEDLKAKVAKAESDNAKLKSDLEKALKESQQAKSLQEENSKLKQQTGRLQADLDKLQKDLDTAVSEARKSASEVAKLRESEAKLKQKVAQLEMDNVKLKKSLDEAKASAAEAVALRAENQKLKAQIKELQDEINRLKAAKDTVVRQPEEDTQGLKDEIAKLKQKVANLQSDNTRTKQQLDEAKNDKLDALKTQMETLQSLKQENEKLRKRVAELESELAKAQKENAGMKTENDKLKGDFKTNKDALNNALQKLEAAADHDAVNDLENLRSKAKALEAELEKQKKECQDTIASMKTQFDRDMKNLLKKHEDSIDQLQKAHADYVKGVAAKHENEVNDLRNAIEQLRQELDEKAKENARLRKLLEDQKRKSIEIKDKVGEVEKVISKERRRSKELEKKHSELHSVASVLEQEVLKERKRSLQLQKEKDDLADKLRASLSKSKQEEAGPYEEKGAHLGESRPEVSRDDGPKPKKERKERKESAVLQKQVEEERRKSEILELTVKSLEEQLKEKPASLGETVDRPSQTKPRKLKDEKLTMTTFETVSLPPVFLAMSSPLSDNELAFYGKKRCPCAENIDDLLKKAGSKGFGALTIEELQLVHKHLSEAAANVLERLGQKVGVLRPNEGRDRLSLLRRIAELEGDLLKKQKQTQQKIAQMQNAIRLEKERLTELRRNLEREKRSRNPSPDPPRRRIIRDAVALEEMKQQLEKRLDEELLAKMKLKSRLAKPRRAEDQPVRDGQCTPRTHFSHAAHSTGRL
ncbi:uncharacterized protein LOC109538520 isoform X1 [Dendroctonus ponderosae]|uniref:uncharacterized protein LOC109538520 isoform X1 n=1 Tax=Dendroctonus ponderosae TaxID=77166 RepID=UPI0020360D6F|nr:uncharacterized protein LOC109538520 isoform X1 [Dendroctonus ponderosae]KAH1024707.1 hypothetical protein HUJ05_004158 [Dendroctonus ponderosae]